MRGQRFAIRVELFPTRSLQNSQKAVFSTAGAAADRAAAPPATQTAQKSQSRPPEPSRPKKTAAQMAKSQICKRVFSEPRPNRRKNSVARLLLLWICHSQCGPHTAGRPWKRCVDFLSWWARHTFCVDLARICRLGRQKACLMVYTSRCKALMKSAASAAFRASGGGCASSRLDRGLFHPHPRCGDSGSPFA